MSPRSVPWHESKITAKRQFYPNTPHIYPSIDHKNRVYKGISPKIMIKVLLLSNLSVIIVIIIIIIIIIITSTYRVLQIRLIQPVHPS